MPVLKTNKPCAEVTIRNRKGLHARASAKFVKCAEADRNAILDDIAYPLRATPAFTQGAAFFASMRDLVATGFYTSRMGIQDIGYMGNQPTTWDGCPAECLDHLGLKA